MTNLNVQVVDRIMLNVLTGKSFSINPLGLEPTKGYMVSIPGGSIIKPKSHAGQLKVTVKCHMLAAQRLEGYVGGWLDAETGDYYLDTSINVDDVNEALILGKHWNQIAVWDVVNQCEIMCEK